MLFPYTLIDLTHPLEPSTPTWSGDCGFHHDLHIDYDAGNSEYQFREMRMRMNAGIGTHMDAPNHCFSSGRCIHDFDVNELCMPCVVLDISARRHERLTLTVEDIIRSESDYGAIPQHSCVMIHTGWSQFWTEPVKYRNNHVFPSISAEAAEHFVKRNIWALGIDTLSPDRPEDGFKVHQVILGSGKILLENVANLANMPPTGSFVMALPLKIKDGAEAPIRLVGLILK